MRKELIILLPICSILCSCTVKRTDTAFSEYTAKNALKPYTKVGKACNYTFGMFQWGDATIEKIAKEHGISSILTVENTDSIYTTLLSLKNAL